jgi:hypothetical protein
MYKEAVAAEAAEEFPLFAARASHIGLCFGPDPWEKRFSTGALWLL